MHLENTDPKAMRYNEKFYIHRRCGFWSDPYSSNSHMENKKKDHQNLTIINPKMDMQKIVTLDGFGVRADPRDHFGKKRNFNSKPSIVLCLCILLE